MNSRYLQDVVELCVRTKAKAAYCIVVDGDRGTGGCPVVQIAATREEYLDRCRELVALLRRGADLLERNVGLVHNLSSDNTQK